VRDTQCRVLDGVAEYPRGTYCSCKFRTEAKENVGGRWADAAASTHNAVSGADFEIVAADADAI
jgi:hypothetical protein